MSSCWKLDAAMRPRFSGLVTTINCLLEKDSGYLELLNLPSFEASSLPFIGKSLRLCPFKVTLDMYSLPLYCTVLSAVAL